MADNDEPAAVRRNDVQQEDGAAEDRLTSLPEDLLFSVVSFLPIKQCVALSALCSHFCRRVPSLTPRLDTFHLYVVGNAISQQPTFPRALIRQCHIHFRDAAYLVERLQRLLAKDLVEAGIQDLTLEVSGERWTIVDIRKNPGFFRIKSLRSVSLHRIVPVLDGFHGRRPPPIACALLTSLKMEDCILLWDNFLRAVLACCPFLETLHVIRCFGHCTDKLSIHSASIKHLVLLYKYHFMTIDVDCPNLESLAVGVVTVLRIKAPKVRNASLLLGLNPPADPPDALMRLLKPGFLTRAAWLILNSSTIPNISAVENKIDRFISPGSMIFTLDFNLKDQSSIMILTQFLKKCNYPTTFDISVYSMHIQSSNEIVKDDHLLHGSTNVELIKLRMFMPEKTFEGFLLNQKKMTEKLKQVGLQKLKSRTNREQFNGVLASNEPLVQVSSSITNCIEMKF